MEKLRRYKNRWFVLHYRSLFSENQNFLGFRKLEEWKKLKVGDLITYYQTRNQRLRGFYKIIRKGINIDNTFGTSHFNKSELKHQCELELLIESNVKFTQKEAQHLEFHKHIRNRNRWDNKRVFEINNEDLDYLLSLLIGN